ncbi:hypothetical protein M1B72_02710 [Geomonas paludis]|uniref:Uncharacterized protein n=1 Tax=Geomonas paludis TaxID=2740185 RepID=A0A6V8N077_9BACT|nr:hypothetical protein [Geomonas paludis]UPU36635.1 hypothetical protein M1B72_02710 [Geomonas paludis]GFO65898.1 hypothetical protein GMPD_38170 [Geomonas paludis]
MQHDPVQALIDKITNTDEAQRKRLLKYAANLPDASRRKAMASAVDFNYKAKSEFPEVGKVTLIYCGFIMGLKDYHYSEHTASNRKNSAEYADLAEEILEERIMKVPKKRKESSIKYKVKAHIGEIHTARKKSISFRDITVYLNTVCKIRVTAEYVRRIYAEYSL